VPDARRAEPRPHGQRGDRVPGLMPGGLHGGGPGRGVAGGSADVVALPDPPLVHDRLVVIADQAGELGADLGQGRAARWCHFRRRGALGVGLLGWGGAVGGGGRRGQGLRRAGDLVLRQALLDRVQDRQAMADQARRDLTRPSAPLSTLMIAPASRPPPP